MHSSCMNDCFSALDHDWHRSCPAEDDLQLLSNDSLHQLCRIWGCLMSCKVLVTVPERNPTSRFFQTACGLHHSHLAAGDEGSYSDCVDGLACCFGEFAAKYSECLKWSKLGSSTKVSFLAQWVGQLPCSVSHQCLESSLPSKSFRFSDSWPW